LFTGYEREDIFEWLLDSLNEIIGPLLRMIFTDEDWALMPAIAKFLTTTRHNVAHRICVFHKSRNFVKHVNASRVSAVVREQAIKLFDEICYSTSQSEVIAAIEKMCNLIPAMSRYLNSEIQPVLTMVTEAYRGESLTLGYHATSVAESRNQMLKNYLPLQIHNLIQIREAYTHAYQVKALGATHRIERQFRFSHPLRELLGAPVSHGVCNLIDKEKAESRNWRVTKSIDEPDCFQAMNEKQIRWRITIACTPPLCKCKGTTRTGLPGAHLIALSDQYVHGHFAIGSHFSALATGFQRRATLGTSCSIA
jgi:hypothetical protein